MLNNYGEEVEELDYKKIKEGYVGKVHDLDDEDTDLEENMYADEEEEYDEEGLEYSEELIETISRDELPDGAMVSLDDFRGQTSADVLSEEELRQMNSFALIAPDGTELRYVALANLMVGNDQYLVCESLDNPKEGYYEIIPYELSQDENQMINIRDFRDEEEFLTAQKAADDMLNSVEVEDEEPEGER